MQSSTLFKAVAAAMVFGTATPVFGETWHRVCTPCTEAPDNKCPSTRGKEYKLECGAWGNSSGGSQCPPGIKVTQDCSREQYCNDQIPEHYSVDLYDGGNVNGKVAAFQVKKKTTSSTKRALITITYASNHGDYTEQQKFILEGGDDCSADLYGEARVQSVSVTEVVDDCESNNGGMPA